MTTGKFKCPICKKLKSYNLQSKLKIDSGRITEISKQKIYDHICMACFKAISEIENLSEVLQ